MEDERDFQSHSPSVKHKFRSSLCFSCCFGNGQHEQLDDVDKPRVVKASSEWLKTRAHEFPEFKEKCRNLIFRMGRGRRHSADFKYDPLSYALNFDEGTDDDHQNEELPLRNFTSRLPASPRKSVAVSEITACS
ncbi:uncharacterized protein LOC122652446 [Telopea speciosissima]|uniref:uncharacterized protein LOC122652446 n=1 Tax=Telopea speciosissima TaxID=54955 RepID=UPI001CC38101|nr:uncharacterized protein LOC122652446 [Telopea speciosissima]